MATIKTNATEVEEKANLVFSTKSSDNLKLILDSMIKDEVFYSNPATLEIGKIESIEVLDKETREKQKYSQIQINVRSAEGKRYTKQWSVEFTRKYLNQIGYKAKDIINAVVIFKPDTRFKNIKAFMFLTNLVDDTEEPQYALAPFINEEDANVLARLEKLGI